MTLVVSISACTSETQSNQEVTIARILSDYDKYENQRIVITGEFWGFETDDRISPPPEKLGVLWLFKDKTGAIYVGGYTGGLNPYNEVDLGIPVRLEVLVKKSDNYVFLEVLDAGVIK